MNQPEDTARAKEHNVLLMGSSEVLASKVRTITGILDCVETMLLSPSEDWSDDADEDDKRRYEGGAVDSAIATYAAGCERLQKILADDAFWTVDGADKAVKEQVIELNKTNVDVAKARLVQQEFLNRPCMRNRVKLYRRFNIFYAVAGEDFNIETSVFGSGKSPKEAMDNFDEVFLSTQQELESKNEQS